MLLEPGNPCPGDLPRYCGSGFRTRGCCRGRKPHARSLYNPGECAGPPVRDSVRGRLAQRTGRSQPESGLGPADRASRLPCDADWSQPRAGSRVLETIKDVPLVADQTEVPPVDVEFCAARAWALAINACWAVCPDAPFVTVIPDVPDIELVVAVEVAVGVVVVPVDAALVVPIEVLLDVVPVGTAANQSTVIFTPPMLALLEPDTTVLVVVDVELDAANAVSNSV